MNTYLLRRVGVPDYGETAGLVVVAATAADARRVAASLAPAWTGDEELDGLKAWGSEGARTWLDPARTTCKQVPTGQPGIILRDFRAG